MVFTSQVDNTARSSKKRPAAESASGVHRKKRREEDTLQTRFEARQTFPLPNLVQRSVQEVTFAAHILDVTGELNVASLAHCLCRGDALGQVDMVFDQLGCACEWDPLWCHSAERVEGDVRKTERMLRECCDLQVVRLRIGAPPLPMNLASSPRYIEITVPAKTSIPKAAQAFGKRISCPEPFASRLRQAHATKRPRAVQVANDLFCLCDAAYTKGFASMVKLVGHNNALNMVQNVHGVRPSIGVLATSLALLRTKFGMTTKQLVTFVCDGVASALAGDSAEVFWAGLEKLRAQGMRTKDLVTFVRGGVASAIAGDTPEVFWAGLEKLRAQGMSTQNLVTFMGDSVASAIVGDTPGVFWAGLEKLRAWGMSTQDLVTFVRNGVASAIAGDTPGVFWAGLEKLRAWGMSTQDLVKFVRDSVVSAMVGGKAAVFWAGLEELRTKVEIADFVCDGIAARLKRGEGRLIVAVVDCIGSKLAKTVLKKQPMLKVLPTLVVYLKNTPRDQVMEALATPARRKGLNAALRMQQA